MFYQGDITQLIPQRDPMVMVDSLIDYSDKHVVSSFLIKESNLFLQGNILVEGGLIEHMAQSVAMHTGYFYFLQSLPSPVGYIGTIQNLEIYSLPQLGDSLVSSVSILEEFMGVTLVEISVKVDNLIVAKGKMKTVIAK